MNFIKASNLIIPVFISTVIIYALYKKVDIYSSFIEGAKNGLISTFKIAPYLVAILVSVSVFKESGAMDFFVKAISPVFNILRIPSEIAPLILIRPFSGSASLAVLDQILKQYGPDSYIGMLASTVMGSAETLFYTIAVYFGAVGVVKSKYTVAVGLIAMLVGVLSASMICAVVFG